MKKITFFVISIYILSALILPMTPFLKDPFKIELNKRLKQPDLEHFFGTDELGRDIFSRLIYGLRLSMVISLISLLISLTFGTFLGIYSAIIGGIFEKIFIKLTDILLAFPGILLSMVILSFLDRGKLALIFSLSITSWISYARISRIITAKLKNEPFTLYSVALGSSKFHLFFRIFLPNILPILLIQATVQIQNLVITESAISFLGIGLPPPTPSIGSIISMGCEFIFEAPHIVLISSLFLILFLWSIYEISQILGKGGNITK